MPLSHITYHCSLILLRSLNVPVDLGREPLGYVTTCCPLGKCTGHELHHRFVGYQRSSAFFNVKLTVALFIFSYNVASEHRMYKFALGGPSQFLPGLSQRVYLVRLSHVVSVHVTDNLVSGVFQSPTASSTAGHTVQFKRFSPHLPCISRQAHLVHAVHPCLWVFAHRCVCEGEGRWRG